MYYVLYLYYVLYFYFKRRILWNINFSMITLNWIRHILWIIFIHVKKIGDFFTKLIQFSIIFNYINPAIWDDYDFYEKCIFNASIRIPSEIQFCFFKTVSYPCWQAYQRRIQGGLWGLSPPWTSEILISGCFRPQRVLSPPPWKEKKN